MTDENTGSIALNIFNSINPLPAGVSGLLVSIVDNNRFFIENFTGDSISDPIANRYKLALTNLSTSNVLKLMAVQDMGVQSVSIGDTSVNNSNLKEMAIQFQEAGMIELKSLSKGLKFGKARG